jgi:hypothetical protein
MYNNIFTLHWILFYKRSGSARSALYGIMNLSSRSFKSKQSLEYIEAELRDFNRDFQARADLAVAAVVIGGTGTKCNNHRSPSSGKILSTVAITIQNRDHISTAIAS